MHVRVRAFVLVWFLSKGLKFEMCQSGMRERITHIGMLVQLWLCTCVRVCVYAYVWHSQREGRRFCTK